MIEPAGTVSRQKHAGMTKNNFTAEDAESAEKNPTYEF